MQLLERGLVVQRMRVLELELELKFEQQSVTPQQRSLTRRQSQFSKTYLNGVYAWWSTLKLIG